MKLYWKMQERQRNCVKMIRIEWDIYVLTTGSL